MALSDMRSRDAVLKAIKEYDDLGQDAFLAKYGFGKARSYLLIYVGKYGTYDSKAIIGAAHGYKFPEAGPLKSGEFNGGESVKKKLEELGFTIQVLGLKGENELDEQEILIAYALRFDGYKYADEHGYKGDAMHPAEIVRDFLENPDFNLTKARLSMYFMLMQRVFLRENHIDNIEPHVASIIRRLFLELCNYEPPVEYQKEGNYQDWEVNCKPNISVHRALVHNAFAHNQAE